MISISSKLSVVLTLALTAIACSGARTATPDAKLLPSDSATAIDAPTGPTTDARPPAGIVLNELVAAGTPDWFEIGNPTAADVELSTYYFSDDLTPATTTGANVAFFAPGAHVSGHQYFVQDVDAAGVGFALGAAEALSLWQDTDGDQKASAGDTLVDMVDWNTGDSPAGGSFARTPDITGAFATVTTPTRGGPN
jgi:hypothetical protein